MKITRLESIPVRVPIKPELAIRGGRGLSHSVSPFLLVRIHTDEGLTGVGEASCTPRWSGEDQVTAAHFVDNYFARRLIGETLGDVATLTASFSSTVANNYFTKSAVEMAIWDLAGKAQSSPVWKLFGERTRDFVPTKWSVSGVEPAKAAEIAAWAVAQGFATMKVKVGIDPPTDIERVRAVREAVGPNIKLGIDANGGWPTPAVAIPTINRLCDESNIYFAEQPVPPGDPAALAEVRGNVPVPIVADESIYTLADAKMLARAEAADVFSVYVGKAGGIAPAFEIAKFADTVGIKCTIGSNLELGVGSAAMIHLALCAPAMDPETYPCDIIGPLFYQDEVLREPLAIAPGSARVPDRPGLSVELSDEQVEKYRVR
jgi:L-alanine-DL-glutamate epimerase-like enolase superfamily enzyme